MRFFLSHLLGLRRENRGPASLALVHHSTQRLDQCAESSYRLPVYVASPENSDIAFSVLVHLLVDTGSPYTWIVSKECKLKIEGEISDCHGSPVPVPCTGPRHRVTFGNGEMHGHPALINLQFSDQSVAVPLRVLSAFEEDGAVFKNLGKFDGILGLARLNENDKEVDKNSFSFTKQISQRVSQNIEIFSISLTPNAGFIHYGISVDTPSDFRRFKLSQSDFWVLQAEGIRRDTVASEPGELGVDAAVDVKVVLDSGTMETALPPSLFNQPGIEKGFILTMEDIEGVLYGIRIRPNCEFISLDLSKSQFEGAIVLGQSFFINREVRFGPDWIDIQLREEEAQLTTK